MTSIEELIFCIHRAIKISASKLDESVIKDYSLKFKYQEFNSVRRIDDLDQKFIINLTKNVLITYEVQKLQHLLNDAVKAFMQKLRRDSKKTKLRENKKYY